MVLYERKYGWTAESSKAGYIYKKKEKLKGLMGGKPDTNKSPMDMNIYDKEQ